MAWFNVISVPGFICRCRSAIEQVSVLRGSTTIILAFALMFYLTLSIKTFFRMLLFGIICIIGNYYLSNFMHLFYTSLIIFALAWVGQFYGHKIEGKKPSFFKDLQFLLIGPAWVFEKILRT